jgi:flagellar secretion chaperone FliS
MRPHDASAAYKSATFENAPPIKIVRMLYQGALRNIEKARRGLEEGDSASFVDGLSRADAIVAELRMCLDHAKAPGLSGQLERLYLFVEERLTYALGERRMVAADEAALVLRRLLSAWTELEVGGSAA